MMTTTEIVAKYKRVVEAAAILLEVAKLCTYSESQSPLDDDLHERICEATEALGEETWDAIRRDPQGAIIAGLEALQALKNHPEWQS